MNEIFEEIYEIARKNRCNFVTSSICLNTNDVVQKRTDYILTKNLFKEYDKDENMVYYCKEIL